MPQYGKYKVKAAHTEVKATFSNIHAAQALYMVDKNEYAPDLDAIDVPTPGGTYEYYDRVATTSRAADTFRLAKGATADKSVFQLYALAPKKLAGCSSVASAPYDAWCLDSNKIMTNVTTTATTGGICTGTLVVGNNGC